MSRILNWLVAPDGHRADDDEDDRNDRGEDRPVEEVRPPVSIDTGPRIRDRCRVDVGSLGRDLDARARPHQTIDDDVVLGHEAADDAQAVDDRPECDVFRPGDVLGIDDQHELAQLLGPDRSLGH
jgi:hypothetical protein